MERSPKVEKTKRGLYPKAEGCGEGYRRRGRMVLNVIRE
jgi:hypothetical protein